jgi:hypothetical protein
MAESMGLGLLGGKFRVLFFVGSFVTTALLITASKQPPFGALTHAQPITEMAQDPWAITRRSSWLRQRRTHAREGAARRPPSSAVAMAGTRKIEREREKGDGDRRWDLKGARMSTPTSLALAWAWTCMQPRIPVREAPRSAVVAAGE